MGYKNLAKRKLSGYWGLVIGAMLLGSLISYFVMKIANMIYPVQYNYDPNTYSLLGENYTENYILTLVFGILLYPVYMGMSRIYYKIIYDLDASIGDLFIYYTTRIWGTIKTILLMNVFLFLWTLLLIIPGLIKTFSYSMTNYIFVDKDFELDGMEAITLSRKMMDGRKMDLFILYLSFIGWFLLYFVFIFMIPIVPLIGILFIYLYSLFIVFYIVPYIEASKAAFYLDVKQRYVNGTGMNEYIPAEKADEYSL